MAAEKQAKGGKKAAESKPAAPNGANGSLLSEIIAKGKMAKDASQEGHARDLVGEFANQILDEGMTVSSNTMTMLQNRIAQLDALISNQVNEILHHPDVQKLEGSWRGLQYLVMNTETGEMLKVRVLCASKQELLKDMESASEFDQSQLFKKVYEEEFGTYGGTPYSVLLGDFELGRHPQDLAFLEKMSEVAAAAHAPFLTAASPKLFDMESFTELGNPRDRKSVV